MIKNNKVSQVNVWRIASDSHLAAAYTKTGITYERDQLALPIYWIDVESPMSTSEEPKVDTRDMPQGSVQVTREYEYGVLTGGTIKLLYGTVVDLTANDGTSRIKTDVGTTTELTGDHWKRINHRYVSQHGNVTMDTKNDFSGIAKCLTPDVLRKRLNAVPEQSAAGRTHTPTTEEVRTQMPQDWTRVQVRTVVGNVEVMVLKPTRGAPPEGVKTQETDVLIVPVALKLKAGATKPIKLTSWMDESIQNKVSLKDDQNRSYDLLDQVAASGSDGTTITEKWLKVQLVFEAPTGTKMKFLRLKLPASALHGDGAIGFEINPSDIRLAPAKLAVADKSTKSGDEDKADTVAKSDQRDSGENTSKSDKPKADVLKTVSLTGTWRNAGGVQVKITDDGESIKLQVGETPTLVSLDGSLTRTEKADTFEGTVQIIPKGDRKRTPLNIPVKATLLNSDELHLVYAHWPTFNRKGIRQIEDTKAEDSIKRVSSR